MGGGHRTEKNIYWKGGTPQYLIEVGTPHVPYWGGDTAHTLLGVGTPHNIERKSLAVVGWVGSSKVDHKATLLLQLARFLA